MDIILHAIGLTGQLTVTDKKIIIHRKGFLGFIARGGFAGNKEIPIKSITAIEFRLGNFFSKGRIQFSVHGESGYKGSVLQVAHDENTIIFKKRHNQYFIKAKQTIEQLMLQQDEKPQNAQVITEVSAADEINKFLQLKEKGIITVEEFELKKKQLLGL